MSKFRTYIDDDDEKQIFTVFLIHGHSEEWRKVEKFIKETLKFNVKVLKEEFTGQVIQNKFKDSVWEECDCAVAILSPDDKIQTGAFCPRQNVLYELGYCQGFFDLYYDEYDLEPVLLIKEQTVQIGSDLAGLECLEYRTNEIESIFHKLHVALEHIFEQIFDKDS